MSNSKENNPLSFDLEVNTKARFVVPKDDWAKALALSVELLKEVQEDEDGSVWAQAVEGNHRSLDTEGYAILDNFLENLKGEPLEVIAEAALLSGMKKSIRESVKELYNEDGVDRIQTVVTITPKAPKATPTETTQGE